MSGILELIDATVDGRCSGPGCSEAITDRSPSAWWCSESCQEEWYWPHTDQPHTDQPDDPTPARRRPETPDPETVARMSFDEQMSLLNEQAADLCRELESQDRAGIDASGTAAATEPITTAQDIWADMRAVFRRIEARREYVQSPVEPPQGIIELDRLVHTPWRRPVLPEIAFTSELDPMSAEPSLETRTVWPAAIHVDRYGYHTLHFYARQAPPEPPPAAGRVGSLLGLPLHLSDDVPPGRWRLVDDEGLTLHEGTLT